MFTLGLRTVTRGITALTRRQAARTTVASKALNTSAPRHTATGLATPDAPHSSYAQFMKIDALKRSAPGAGAMRPGGVVPGIMSNGHIRTMSTECLANQEASQPKHDQTLISVVVPRDAVRGNFASRRGARRGVRPLQTALPCLW